MKAWPSKDPAEELRYTYDWSPDLDPGETIASIAVDTVTAAGTTLVAEQYDASTVTLIIGGGTEGGEAEFQIRVTTSLNNTFEDQVLLPIATKVVPAVYPGGYADPTPANLIAVFPEFSNVPQTQLQYYLDRAATYIDTSWQAPDFGHARMLLAAHLLTLSGIGNTAAARDIASGFDQFRSVSVSGLTIQRMGGRNDPAQTAAGTGVLELNATRYGRELRALVRRNKGGPRVTGGITSLPADGDRTQSPTYPWGG